MSEWVIDATTGKPDHPGAFVFVPVDGDFPDECTFVVGLSVISTEPPKGGRLVGVIHADGQDAAHEFCEAHADELEALSRRIEEQAQ